MVMAKSEDHWMQPRNLTAQSGPEISVQPSWKAASHLAHQNLQGGWGPHSSPVSSPTAGRLSLHSTANLPTAATLAIRSSRNNTYFFLNCPHDILHSSLILTVNRWSYKVSWVFLISYQTDWALEKWILPRPQGQKVIGLGSKTLKAMFLTKMFC